VSAKDSLPALKPAKRIRASRGIVPLASDRAELEARIAAITKIARAMVRGPVLGTDGLHRTLVDDKLDAIVAERDAAHGDICTNELARVYDLPEHLVKTWLEANPDPLDGLYDDDDESQPAAHRHQDERDDASSFTRLGQGVGRPYFRSGLPPGRPKDVRDPRIIEHATGFTIDRCRELVRPGNQQRKLRSNDSTTLPFKEQKEWLGMMLGNIVKHGELGKLALSEMLECDRRTVERLISRSAKSQVSQ
jgi:hypothetical protein